ncbi:DNA polymerase III subunit epsilon [Candidatus Trichorickettsia mobilis]|uniref:DNA polymerase III subunit epsilon n=1 Tax=Candidatus Trichorickettsia mobilis TaxID=1346319 RepID=UPI00292CBB90|nr:DNA polymerase III subunit epsilon [Candidatus Trichorickettsia mobilis]
MNMREIIIDTETTGLDPRSGHRIVEIGALEMIDRVLTGAQFHFYLNPERDMPTEAYRIHGISGEFLKNKPLFKDVAIEFLQFISDSKLVIHNAQFDVKFLNHELSLINQPSIELNNTIDTLAISRKMFPGMKVSLDALCKRFNVDNSARQFHGALKDAVLLAEVYVELLGGKQGFFEITNTNQQQKSAMAIITSYNVDSAKLKVISPTRTELENHNNFLTKLVVPSSWL